MYKKKQELKTRGGEGEQKEGINGKEIERKEKEEKRRAGTREEREV